MRWKLAEAMLRVCARGRTIELTSSLGGRRAHTEGFATSLDSNYIRLPVAHSSLHARFRAALPVKL